MKKDLLWLMDLSSEDVWRLIFLTDDIKNSRIDVSEALKGYVLGMIFEKPSTRTRISFEVAMYELGGHAIYLPTQTLQISRGESIKDTAKVLSRYVDIVMARVYSHKTLEELAKYTDIPVINGLSDLSHPVQALSDFYTIYEHFGKLKGLKITYVGDGNNVANSLLLGAAKLGLHIVVATPKGYEPSKTYIDNALKISHETGAKIELLNDPYEAVKDANVIYTDTFVSMGQEKEREERLKVFMPKYQVNMDLIKASGRDDVVFMHCLPAHRGEEVTDEVIDSDYSIVYDQAENRLHMQKAILLWIVE
jgi:ornithine carbamoyltransferase